MSGALATRFRSSGSGLPLLLLHGFLGSSADWDGFDAGDRAILAPDLPGHGDSAACDDDAYTLDGAAAACLRAVDARGWHRFAVLGYSMGGRIACRLTVQAPDRVAALVAVAAHPGFSDATERKERLEVDRRRAALLARNPDDFLRGWYDQPVFASVAARPGLRRRLEGRFGGVVPAGAGRALAGFSVGGQDPVGERLAALGVPVLLVSGRLDAAYGRLLADWSGRYGPAWSAIPGAGHAVPFEQPVRLARVVRSFLDALPADGPESGAP